MAIDKGTTSSLIASGSIAGGASSSGVGWFNALTKVASTVYFRVVNGSPGPAGQPVCKVEVADDDAGTNPRTVYSVKLTVAAAATTDLKHELDITHRFIRATIDNTAGGANAITGQAHAHHVDSL